MPINNVSNSGAAEKGPGGGGRTTFRPPWVKDGPQPIPMPKAPWSKRQSLTPVTDVAAESETKENPHAVQLKSVKLQSKEVKVPVESTIKKTPARQLTTTKPKVTNEDTEGVKNGLKNLLRKTESINQDDEKKPSPKVSIDSRMAAKKAAEEASTPGSVEKPGKFVRPVLKKVARVEPELPPAIKPTPAKPIAKIPAKEESESEEEETESEEEETETEEETESESEEEIVVKKASNVAAKPAAKTNPVTKVSTASKPATPAPKPVLATKSNGPASVPPPPPPPPPISGCPPPPPPPPGLAPPSDFQKKPISEKHKDYLERLKNRPRKRPDWSDMMKEVESGRKLRHVQCNDRSSPILTSKSITNIKGQFVYETEKANVHNILLKQIQFGVKLKTTKTNDRSKPVLDGLRKFRRQMTIEEQILKSESRAQLNVAPDEESEDEMDDIDKLRDDLQSSKQMLALELRSKEAQERENKRLLSKIQMLEAELDREKEKNGKDGNVETKPSVSETPAASKVDDTLVKSLKAEAEEAQKTSKMLETKYQDVAEKLDSAKGELEEQRRMIANLERKLAQQTTPLTNDVERFNFSRGSSESPEPDRFNCNYMWQTSGTADMSRRQSEAVQKESSPEPEPELSEDDEEEDEEKKAERLARRLNREVKMMSTRIARLKDKERAAKKERENLRDAMKKNQGLLKVELKKFKKLQREVDKMAAMMKEDEDENEDEDAEPKEDPDEEDSAEESEDDSESEESEDESESETSESEPEDSPDEKKKTNYEPRIKRHDGRLSALKKGNYLVQANVDRLQDEINKMREKSVTLQADLDSVLSELG